jgi:hypothetical protein
MLRKDVVEACAEGRFAVYGVASIDEGIEILTGIPAGRPDETGAYSIGTVNRAVALRLARFASVARKLARDERRRPGAAREKKDERERGT